MGFLRHINWITLLVLVTTVTAMGAVLSRWHLRRALLVARKLVIPLSIQLSLVGLMKMLVNMDDPLAIGPAGMLAMISPLYGVVIYLILRIVIDRLPAVTHPPPQPRYLYLSLGIYLVVTLLSMGVTDFFGTLEVFFDFEAFAIVVMGALVLMLIQTRHDGVSWAPVLQKSSVLMGGIGLMLAGLYFFESLPDYSKIGSALSLGLLSSLYGSMLYIVAILAQLSLPNQALISQSTGFLTTFHTKIPVATIQHGIQFDEYWLSDVIGEGGMGRVYRARHQDSSVATRQGEVAIKLLKATLAQDAIYRARFSQEAALGLKMDHPSLATIYELVDTKFHLGLVMEYIEGSSFKDYMGQPDRTLAGALETLEAIASVLDYLHTHDIIHRDVKPDNIRIRANGIPVLLDLGIAKVSSSVDRLTRTGMTLGTIIYMAPEQVETSDVGPAVDQYALGMIVYELLAHRLPWEDDLKAVQIFVVKQRGNLMSIRTAAPTISEGVAAVLHRALTVRPDERYESCGAFIRALVVAYDGASSVRLNAPKSPTQQTEWAATGVTLPLNPQLDDE